MASLNQTILSGLQSQLMMAMASDNEPKIAELKAAIGLILRDMSLREECGLPHGDTADLCLCVSPWLAASN